MHSKDNWDDLRYVLSVAELGTVSAAARALRVNHATVLRHIAAFESRHDLSVFDKTVRGYAVSDAGAAIIDAARDVRMAMATVERVMEGAQIAPQGVFRVTSTDTFCHLILPPIVTALSHRVKDLRFDLVSTNAHVDLARLQADVTVRPTARLPEELKGEVAAKLGFGVYAAPGIGHDRWLVPGGTIARSRIADWIGANVPAGKIAGAADSFMTLRELAANGLGRSFLPCFIADDDPRLVRLDLDYPDIRVDIWVASHAELAGMINHRLVRGLLCEELSGLAQRLAGEV